MPACAVRAVPIVRVVRAVLFVLLVLSVAPVTPADDKDKPTVKEIPTKDLKLAFPDKSGRATEPAVVTSADDLAKNPVVRDAADDLKKLVNFEKEKLLVFAWQGSGQDKVTLSIGSEGGQSIVYGEYIRGFTRDLRRHIRLFVVPKDLKVVMDVK